MLKKVFTTLLIFIMLPLPVLASIYGDIPVEREEVFFYAPRLTEEEIEAEIERQIQVHIDEFVFTNARNRDGFGQQLYRSVGREQSAILRGRVGGQPPGGRHFPPTGGAWFYSSSGGPEISASVNFPAPFNFLSVSINAGSVGSSGSIINGPTTGHFYHLYVNRHVFATPFELYTISGGQRVVMSRGTAVRPYRESHTIVRAS